MTALLVAAAVPVGLLLLGLYGDTVVGAVVFGVAAAAGAVAAVVGRGYRAAAGTAAAARPSLRAPATRPRASAALQDRSSSSASWPV